MKCDDSFFGAEADRIDRLVSRMLDDSDADEPRDPAACSEGVVEQPGSQIGRYKLLEVLGEGGMGVVYLAEQGHPVRRQVALKIIKPGMDSRRVLRRFEAEQQALAMMEHPHIARVYDAGLAPSSRPYFVMEHVHGLPITRHCDEHRLTVEQRLHLFLHVCEAIQHAHRKGIIHRDLKPSNILVVAQDDEMIPKVIDFGVARALSHPLTEPTLYTEQGQLIGTPAYMSPEQADPGNQDIDTRSDIYSLGVVLYELLAGALPFDPQSLGTGGIEQIRKVIREHDPKTPSTRLCKISAEESAEAAHRRQTDVRALQRKLRGDLDWITLKALEKDRTRRYSTAEALAADIRKHLEHQPVSAAPPTTLYQAGKFARRHRQTLAAVAIGALLFGVLLWATWAHRQTARERTRARALEHRQILEEARRLFESRGMEAPHPSASSSAVLAMIEPLLASRHVGAQAELLFAGILVEHRYCDEAVPRLERLLHAPPETAGTAYALLARTLWENSSLGSENLARIERYQKKAQELLPDTAEAYYLRAMTAFMIPEKLELLAHALDLDPGHYPSRRLRALTYHASRKYEQLKEDALLMTHVRPGDPLGYFLRAAALKELGRYQDAVACYDSAIALAPLDDPQYLDLNVKRCEVLMQMGQYARVLADAREGLKISADATALQSHVFCALTALGRYEEAHAFMQSIVESPDRGDGNRIWLRSMKHVFDTLAAGGLWHPPDHTPEGPFFFYMFEAEKMHRSLSAKARRLITNCFSPCWSPDGTKVAYAHGLPGYSGVAVYDLLTKETDLLTVPGKDPSWSPDGRHIAYVRDAQALHLSELTMGRARARSQTRSRTEDYRLGEEIWVMKADGSAPRRLARHANCPSWSPDSNRVYYHAHYTNMVYSVSIEDPLAQPVPVSACTSEFPAVSPQGDYVANLDGGMQRGAVLRIVDVATQSCIAEWPTPLESPAAFWSPDGRELSLGGLNGIRARTGLWIYDIAEGEGVKVFSGHFGGASWSRDRTRLLVRLALPFWEAWIADLDPDLSTAESLSQAQTLEEHCLESIAICTRDLEAAPNSFVARWTRATSALWIGHSQAPAYLQEMDRHLGGPSLRRSSLNFGAARNILVDPALCKRLGPMAWVLARRAVEQQPGYAEELADLFGAVGQHADATRLLQIAEALHLRGTCRYDGGSDTYAVVGCGAGIAGAMDEFHFVYKILEGNGSITARVESIEDARQGVWAGVMIRQGLDPGARFAAVFATPGSGVRYHTRPIANRSATSDDHLATPEQTALCIPIWVRLVRQGSHFSAFYSSDGAAWTPMVWNPQTVSMLDPVYIGMAVNSHDNTTTAEARFSHVTTTGDISYTTPFEESQDIRLPMPPAADTGHNDK